MKIQQNAAIRLKSLWFLTKILLFVSNVMLSHQTYQEAKTSMVFKWKTPEFEYTNSIQKEQAIPLNVPIIDADFYPPTGRYFVTSPQVRDGIPATVYEVHGQPGILKPFPKWHTKMDDGSPSCEDPYSVYRIFIDKCGLLWVLDSGKFGFTLKCKPKLIIYDLNNWDREVLRYEFPMGAGGPANMNGSAAITDRSSLLNIITESYRNDCSDSVAYIADVNDHGLVVFDLPTATSWRVESRTFYPYPDEFSQTINGVTFEVMAGLMGLALDPPTERDRKLYHHSYTSSKESWVSVNILKNRTALRDPEVVRTNFYVSPGQRADKSTVEVMTDDGVLIYVLITMNAIACWNSKTPYTIENQHILERDDVNFQFISGLKLKNNKYLLITSSRFQNFNIGKVNPDEYNYRVMMVEDVDQLLRNTPCRPGFGVGNGIAGENESTGNIAAPSRAPSYNSFNTGPYGNGDAAINSVSRGGQSRGGSQETYSFSQSNSEFQYGGWFKNFPYNGFDRRTRWHQ